MDVTYLSLLVLLISPLVIMVIHIILIKIRDITNISLSNQMSLLVPVFLLNIPMIALIYYLNRTLASILYSFIVYNSLAYSYFHFFNMSETARRICIILKLKNSPLKIKELEVYYNKDMIIPIRLQRLMSIKQVKKVGNKYFLCSRLLWVGASLVFFWRKLLGFDKN